MMTLRYWLQAKKNYFSKEEKNKNKNSTLQNNNYPPPFRLSYLTKCPVFRILNLLLMRQDHMNIFRHFIPLTVGGIFNRYLGIESKFRKYQFTFGARG